MEGNQVGQAAAADSPQPALSLAEHREIIAAARSSMTALGSVLWQAPSGGGADGLAGLMTEVDGLGMACDASRVAVLREAMNRGESSGGSAAMTTAQWVRHHAPSTKAGGVAAIVSLATAFGKVVNAPVREAVESGRLPVRSAAAVVSEADKLRPLLAEGAEPHVLAGLIDIAEQHGPSGCRDLRDALVAKYGQEGLLQDQQTMGKSFIRLSQPADTGAGTFEYRLTLDVEGKAILEAALGPLSAPRPVDGERDLRSFDRRRGDALVSLVRRAVAAGDERGRTNKTTLLLTMSYEDLKDRLGAATTVGGLDAGTHLAPETVRRLCCDGSVIPIVLGMNGAVLDWGLERRFFTDAQVKRLWLRDGGCTYPGCGAPPSWTDAHHRPLGRPRPLRPGQRGPALRAAPHGRAHPPPRRPGREGDARRTGRVGPHPRQLRRPARPTGRLRHRERTSVTPPHTPPTTGGAAVMSGPGEVLPGRTNGSEPRRPAPNIALVTTPHRSTPASAPGLAVNPVQGLLLALVFVFEVLGLVAVAWWAVSLGGVLGIVVAVVAVAVMAALWGRFAAPRAASRLRGVTLAVFMLAWFAVGGVCLAALGQPWWGVGLVAGFAATKLLLRATGHRTATPGAAPATVPTSTPAPVQGEGPDVGQ